MPTLYLVATPIGNLEDISARALRILREAGLIAAEDTRHTRKLLTHFEIHTPLTSYHDHNKAVKADRIIEALQTADVALVSDAGTPGINDPGYELVRAAVAQGITVTPIPGPSAPIAALSASGLSTDTFLFMGYLPRKKKARDDLLRSTAGYPFTLIFLETPHRLLASLAGMVEILGDRDIAVARELTKIHEEIFRGKVSEALTHFTSKEPRGEFTLVLEGADIEEKNWGQAEVQKQIAGMLASGRAPSEIAKEIGALSGWGRREVYRVINEIKK